MSKYKIENGKPLQKEHNSYITTFSNILFEGEEYWEEIINSIDNMNHEEYNFTAVLGDNKIEFSNYLWCGDNALLYSGINILSQTPSFTGFCDVSGPEMGSLVELINEKSKYAKDKEIVGLIH